MLNEETWSELSTNPNTLYIGADVGSAEMKLAVADRQRSKPLEKTVSPFDDVGLLEVIKTSRRDLGLEDGPVVFVHEAGRDGFSLHWWLDMLGVHSIVVDPASIETSARKRRAKTDRLDARLLLSKVRSYFAGHRGAFAVVRVPSEEVEDERRRSRELKALKEEAARAKTRLNGLLAQKGVKLALGKDFVGQLKQVTTPWGTRLPPHLKAEILRQVERLELVESHIAQLEQAHEVDMAAGTTEADRQGAQLIQLVGVGPATAMMLPKDFFWRDFNNGKEVGAAAGLTGTPRVTGTSTDIEQGISKAGNSRVRTLMIEIAWMWVRLQPDNSITKWFSARMDGTKRNKRKYIVAVARKLLIALWRYATRGVVPDGARLKTAH
jgi:transposase